MHPARSSTRIDPPPSMTDPTQTGFWPTSNTHEPPITAHMGVVVRCPAFHVWVRMRHWSEAATQVASKEVAHRRTRTGAADTPRRLLRSPSKRHALRRRQRSHRTSINHSTRRSGTRHAFETSGASTPHVCIYMRGLSMKSDSIVDGGRQRCVACGHPRREHRTNTQCTVPKCACTEYQLPKDR